VLWGTIFDAFSALLGVTLVPYSEWLARLEESGKATVAASGREKNDDLRNNPAGLVDSEGSEVVGLFGRVWLCS
jgi:hypothetical protein